MSETGPIILCSLVSRDDVIGKDSVLKRPLLSKACCHACAWREEQLRQREQNLKHQTSPTDVLLRNVADRFLPSPDFDGGEKVLVRRVVGPLTERQIRYGNILSHAIRCKTVSHDDPARNVEARVEFMKLHELLKTSFPVLYGRFPPRIVNGYSLLFVVPGADDKKGGGEKVGKPVMLCSHLDVVPAETNEDYPWEHEPFEGKIVDGIVWGRGAIDNKHNVIGQLGALEEILSSGNLPKRTIYVGMGHDEEIEGKFGAAQIAQVLEKENIKFEYILDEGAMMVSGVIPGISGPVALIGVGEKGYLNVELTVTGPGGHSSAPPLDEDNILKVMGKAVVALESNPIPAHFDRNSGFRVTLEYVANKLAFPFNVLFANLWLIGPLFKQILLRASNGAAASLRTTTAVTKIIGGNKLNALPSHVVAYVNHRVHPNDSMEFVAEHDRRVINDDRVKLKIISSLPPSPISDHVDAPGFDAVTKSVDRIFGVPSAPMLCIGNTDTRWYWKLSENIYRFSPVPLTMKEVQMFHGVNERIGVDSLTLIVDFYKVLLLGCEDDDS